MKVKIAFTLNVNEDAWATDYGMAPEDVRADVQEHVQNIVREHLHSLSLLKEWN